MQQRETQIKRFVLIAAIIAGILPLIPFLFGLLGSSGSNSYLGYQYNTDDHMVYAAWMRQAMDGSLLFDNRFTTDAQPGITIQIYFFVLGFIAKGLGISFTTALIRGILNVVFIFLLSKIVSSLTLETFCHKLALTLSVLGGGLGYLVWHNFGTVIVKPTTPVLRWIFQNRLPIDVWQPEAFVFSSMLTNGLFMVSLCLIAIILLSIVNCRKSWKPVLPGFLAFAVLANIHSYDVLLMGFCLFAFLIGTIVHRDLKAMWLLRCIVIASGILPAALWLYHVLSVDPVFQARAATETYAPAFRQVLFGLLPLVVLGLARIFTLEIPSKRKALTLSLFILFIALLSVFSSTTDQAYWMSLSVWIVVYFAAIALAALISGCSLWERLIWTFAIVGLIAIYFPALYQRKLDMGISIYWGLLAAMGFGGLAMKYLERSKRNLTTVLVIVAASGSSALWFVRELQLIGLNVSSTAMHSVYLSGDVHRIVHYLNSRTHHRTVVFAMPGIWSPDPEGRPDKFNTPLLPDLNPILSGLTGAYTFAGHWSETPDYLKRRSELTTFFIDNSNSDQAMKLLKEVKPNYIVAPAPEAFKILPIRFRDMRQYGKVVVSGLQFSLIEVDPKLYSRPD
jgi:arabinosyltransferase C